MTKETKNIITHQSLKKQLFYDNKINLIKMITLAPFSVISAIALVYTVKGFLRDLDGGNYVTAFVLAVLSLMFFMVIGFEILTVWIYFNTSRKVKNSSFSVVEDVLVRLEEIEEVHHGRGHSYVTIEQYLLFRGGMRYHVTPIDGRVFEYSEEGDKFYLVVLDGELSPSFAYNTKIYEYRR